MPTETPSSRRENDNGPVTRAEFLQGLREMREDFGKRFEEMDKRFEVRFEAIDKRFEAVDLRFEALRDWVSLVVGRLQTRAGRHLENTVAGALRLALSMYDITPDQVLLRQKIADVEGKIGPKGREYEFDILAKNGETYIFEVKSTPEAEDVLRFNDKAELAASILKPPVWKKVLVTLDKDAEVLRKAESLGILVV
ncbi:MAG: hypothetical protein HY720_01310 [Planctomycetes bacterium]|nr:hypothetical protein [Planctomycetota bacterium]